MPEYLTFQVHHSYRFCKLSVIAALLLSLPLMASQAASSDWPNWRGSNYDGISQEKGWDNNLTSKSLNTIWTKSIGTGYSSAAVANGRVYITGNTGKKGLNEKRHKDVIYCFDAATGDEKWTYEYPHPLAPKYYTGGTSATPTVDGDRVYTFSKQGDLYCFNAISGDVIWNKNLMKEFKLKMPIWGFATSAVIQDNMLILNAGSCGIALEKSDGKLIWKTGTDAAGYATPVPFTSKGKKLLAMFAADAIVALTADGGKEVWRHPWITKHGANCADPIISDDKVFISSDYGKGCTLIDINGSEPKEVYMNRDMKTHMSGCVLVNGKLYGFDSSTLKCIDFNTGKVHWSADDMGKGSLMAAGDKLIIISGSGKLVIAKATHEKFLTLAESQLFTEKGLCWTMPILSNGKIYARRTYNDKPDALVCVEIK